MTDNNWIIDENKIGKLATDPVGEVYRITNWEHFKHKDGTTSYYINGISEETDRPFCATQKDYFKEVK